MEFMKTVALRRSTRAFTQRQVEKADLDAILYAGCAAPVANGEHDRVRLTVVTNKGLLEKLGRATAKALKSPGYDPFYGAGTFVLVSVRPRGGEPNIEFADGACVVENMLLAATSLGIDSVYLWGFRWGLKEEPALLRELHIPEGFVPVSGAALGYGTEPPVERPLDLNLTCEFID